jgi:fructuronate reductase
VSGPQPSGRALSRGDGRPAAPVRLVHLGLGNFFRAHQAWYTDRAPDAADWGIAAFTGRSGALADSLAAQDGLYTLITRAAEGDHFEVVSSLTRTHPGTDHDAWCGYLASPDVRGVTLTVTEAGYVRGADGGLDRDRPEIRADVQALRSDLAAPVHTAPARLVAGCAGRRRADAGPLALVSCDNLPGNGEALARVVGDLAEMVEPGLAEWVEASVSFVTTMVDRITPRTTPEDRRAVAEGIGRDDCCPVATEPFSEWVLSGAFPGGRPDWDGAGATITDEIEPYEHRKLWLLNGAHSILAYAGSARGHRTVAEAVADDTCRDWMQQWWAEASRHLDLPTADIQAYRDALLERFANPRMHHRLAQIAADGSQKLPVRILPVLRRERSAGRMPEGAARALAAWVMHLRGAGAPVDDVRAGQMVALAGGPLPDAIRHVLDALDPAVGEDAELVAAVLAGARQLAAEPAGRKPT